MKESPSKVDIHSIVGWVVWPLWILLAFQLGGLLVGTTVKLLNIHVSSTPGNILLFNAITYIVILAIIVIPPLLIRAIVNIKDFALSRAMAWSDIGWALLGFAGYMITTVLVSYLLKKLFPGLDLNQEQDLGFQSVFGVDKMLAFFMLVVIAPLVEEGIFRGLLQTKLKQLRMPIWLVIIVVSLVFAIAHGQLNVAIDVFALGVILGLLREKTKSIWASILVHAMKNALAFYILFVVVS